ncbi:MAG: 30S ribosomal protein S21 [bacterium]|nr:30S ribosomal protein S21 [bacterium]
MQVKKRENESASSLIYRFTKRVRQSGVLLEAKKRRFKKRDQSRIKRRSSAIYRDIKKKEVVKAKKLGLL